MSTIKMRLAAVALTLCVVLSACAPANSFSAPVADSKPASSQPASSQSAAPSQSDSQSQPAASSDPVEVVLDGLKLSSPQLDFSVQLPAMLEGHLNTAVTTTDAYGEVMTTVVVSYQAATDLPVLLFDEMSTAVWAKMKAEGGPLGTELGTSTAGRVVVMNTLQSNPFAEGTEEYKLFQEWPVQLATVKDSFAFSE